MIGFAILVTISFIAVAAVVAGLRPGLAVPVSVRCGRGGAGAVVAGLFDGAGGPLGRFRKGCRWFREHANAEP